jgi:hypothetical protein
VLAQEWFYGLMTRPDTSIKVSLEKQMKRTSYISNSYKKYNNI